MKKVSNIYVGYFLFVIFIASCQKPIANEQYTDNEPTKADFTIKTQYGGELGESIKFENHSSNYDKCIWDFGDSTISTDKSPVHIYQRKGRFKIKLIVLKKSVIDSTFKELTITDAMVVDFRMYDDSSRAPCRILFENNSKGARSFEWDLGNGQKMFAEGGHVDYPYPGNYQVKLTAFDNFNHSKTTLKGLTILPAYKSCTINIMELVDWPWVKSDNSDWDQGNWQEKYPDIYFIVEDSIGNKLIQTDVITNKMPGKAFYTCFLDLNKSNWNQKLIVKMMDEDGAIDELMFQATVKSGIGDYWRNTYPLTFGINHQYAEFYFYPDYK
jgi:hypothetical protein